MPMHMYECVCVSMCVSACVCVSHALSFFSICLFTLIYSGFFLLLLLDCFFSKEKEKEGMDLDGSSRGEDLGEP